MHNTHYAQICRLSWHHICKHGPYIRVEYTVVVHMHVCACTATCTHIHTYGAFHLLLKPCVFLCIGEKALRMQNSFALGEKKIMKSLAI